MISVTTILGVVLAGIAGCFATGFALQKARGVPGSVVYGNWKKHVWSIIFAVPLIWMMSLGLSVTLATIVAFVWLALAPTIASKFYFGPKDTPFTGILQLHIVFAAVALAVFLAVVHLI
jgi:hypothetical protein